ncbi:MAG: hypothetical protein ACK54X_25345 [Burkholderiales bacterium]|jgi:acyl-CoA dehydrogenase
MDEPDADAGGTRTVVRALLAPHEAGACDTAVDWVATWRAIETAPDAPHGALDRALLASARAERLAWAFLCAYQAAIRDAFAPAAPRGALGSFAANEAGRRMTEIATRLVLEGRALRLEGAKSWVLRAADPFSIHVLARAADGPASGPGSLVVVTVRSDAPGVSLHEGRPQSVVPELPHAAARFDGVAIEPGAVLAGDGYADHARPFRLAEDLCLAACALAWLLGEAGRHHWPDDWRQRAVAAVVMLRDAYARRSTDAAIEVLAAGALSLASSVVDAVDDASDGGSWPEASRARWRRDRVLLSGAGGVRPERARSAWKRLGDGR